jgi:NAD(P)-dependent dehydrogenase (short-subunit alcohol dehydrogenase family)/acyl carrier protein
MQACERLRWAQTPAIWLVTRGAQAVLEDNLPLAAAQATLWGLGRVAAVELPEHWGGLIDLEPGVAAGPAAEFLLDELLNPGVDDQVAFYQGQRYAARLAQALEDRSQETPATAAKSPFALQKSAAYLITGGMGGIGLEIAKGMAERGARRLILMGRTPLPPRAEWRNVDPEGQTGKKITAIRQIEAAGASVQLAFVDLADAEELNAFLLAYQDEGWPAIRGVIHAAAVSEDRLIAQMDTEALFRVFRSKMLGAWLLHRAFQDVDFFVMLSSLGALLGQPGQSAYAAANAFLDALAHTRRSFGLPALSIDVGGWAETGFAATLGGRRTVDQLEQQGFDSFSIQSGLEAFFQLLQSEPSTPQIAAVPVDWQKVRQSRVSITRGGLLADLLDSAPASSKKDSGETGGILQELSAAGPENAAKLLEAYVQKQVAQVLKLPAERIEPARPLGSLGVDSLMAIELRNRLEAGLGIALSATLVWNYPTIAEMVPFLAKKIGITTVASQSEAQAGQIHPSQPGQDAAFDQTITTVAGLSDDEALQLLLGNS